jgi:hypothetical protein
LGIREAAMTHMAHGASMTTRCYDGDWMWRCGYRKSDYHQTIVKRTGGAADALAKCFYGVPGGCHLRYRDERGAV